MQRLGTIPPAEILLRTKLYIPPVRPKAVARPRLLQRLNSGLERPLTLISAPAGFGKTTLLSSWLTQPAPATSPPGAPAVAWISLDEGDNDPLRFGQYLWAALSTLEIGIGRPVGGEEEAGPGSPRPLDTVLATVINQVSELSEDVVLVLDDYHLITAQPIHEAIAFLLQHLPPQLHLVIASRADPPLPLAHLRVRGQLVELRAADLRFTPAESGAFLDEVMGLHLPADTVAALEARTEGWVAGLQMAALVMQGHDDAPGLVRTFNGSHRYIVDYLAEQVLQQQPPQIQKFLLETSVLDRLTGPLCDAVVGERWNLDDGSGAQEQPAAGPPDGAVYAQAVLEHLERANLFLVPLDDNRRWYRYHHLFADFLRERLRQTSPVRWSELNRRAAEWCERSGLIAEAVGHALAVGEAEQAARLIEQIAEAIWMRGEMIRLLGWLEALPDDLVRSRPRLCIFHAWILNILGDFEAAQARLAEAQAGLDQTPPESGSRALIRGMLSTVQAIMAIMDGDAAQARQLSHQALADLPEANLVWRSVVVRNLGNAQLLLGQTLDARETFAEAVELSRQAGNAYMTLVCMYELAELQIIQGQLRAAAQTCQAALQAAAGTAGPVIMTIGALHIGLCEVFREWNQLEAGVRHALQGIEYGLQGRSLGIQVCGYIRLGLLAQAQGDSAGAARAFERASQLAPVRRRTSFLPHHDAQARLWARQPDPAAAAHWAEARGLRADDEPGFMNEAAYLTLARVLLARDQPAEALGLLARLRRAAESAQRHGRLIEILVIQALAFQALSQTEQAAAGLEQALRLAEPEGYVRVFVDEGPALIPLLRQAWRRATAGGLAGPGVSAAYVAQLLSASGQPPGSSPRPEAAAPPAHTLSERELEVLRLLAAGLSNREIALRIVVSPGTVKRHIHNIYGKLNTHNRLQTVERAREWSLV